MKLRRNCITSTLTLFLCTALLLLAAREAAAVAYTWDGNGTPDADGDWSDPLNWNVGGSYPDDATDTATLPYPTGTRIITVDVPITIDQIAIAEGAFNIVQLDANMEVRLVDHPSDDGHPRSEIDLNGNVLTVDSGSATYFPNLDGAGEFVKIGTGQVTLNGELAFTGSFTISNGVIAYRCGDYSATSATVLEGGTARSHDVCATMPGTFTINGDGYTSRGAIEFAAPNEPCASDITVASDAKIRFISGTTAFSGDILGSGVLTLEGPQTVDISASGITYTNKLIVTNGTTQISGDFPDLKHILVDQGGTLEGLQAQFPSASVVTQNGGIWIQNLSATWTGAGDGSNWTDTANWSPAIVPTNVATIPYPGAARIIMVDAPAYVDQLAMAEGANNILKLDADMEAVLVDHPSDDGHPRSEIDLNGNVLTTTSGSAAYFPNPDGAGTIVKNGPGRIMLNGELAFTGSFTINDGDVAFRCGDFSAASATVVNGGTARSHDVCSTMPGTITINGPGYLSRGAIEFAAPSEPCASDITVASDAKIKFTSGTTAFSGDILGPGVLTLEGPQSITISASGITYTNKLIVTNGTTTITGDFPDLKHILVDQGGTLEGLQSQFPSASVVTQNGGIWIQDADATWTGAGDGSNWTDVANWSPNLIPTNLATIPYPGAARTIVVDAAAYLNQLAMAEGANNILKLDADMEIILVDNPSDDGSPASKIELNGKILTVNSGSATYFPTIGGAGTIMKNSTGQLTLNGASSYTGGFTINDGVVAYRCGDYSAASATVANGGTARGHDVCATMPGTFTINGAGYTSRGAIEFAAGTDTFAADVTVASDAKIKFLSGTTTFTGDILGTGVLTLEGPQTVDINTSGITYTNKLIVTNGTTLITGDFPDLLNILVDQGGTLEGLQSQFPSASVVTQNGGIWLQNANATWTGAGDGSNWTDTANWSPGIIPTNTATIPTPGGAQTIVVDAPAYVATLDISDSALTTLRIPNAMEVGFIDGIPNGQNYTVDIDGATLTVHRADSAFFGTLDGNGNMLKEGTGRVLLNAEANFTGSFTINNGDVAFRCGDYSAASVTVANGGTARGHDVCATMPGTFTINGAGYTARGAIEFAAGNDTFAADVTVASDARIKCLSGTTTMSGDILGSGILTLRGSATLDLDGTFNFAISGANANSIESEEGTFNIGDATLDVSNETGASELEYMVIDYSGGGTVVGQFTATNDLDTGWAVEYAGTVSNPNAVVLVKTASPPETVIKFL